MVSSWTSMCLSACRMFVRLSVFRFRMMSKHQWIFTNHCVCIDIVEIGLGLLMVKFLQIFTELSARDMPIFSFPGDNLSK